LLYDDFVSNFDPLQLRHRPITCCWQFDILFKDFDLSNSCYHNQTLFNDAVVLNLITVWRSVTLMVNKINSSYAIGLNLVRNYINEVGWQQKYLPLRLTGANFAKARSTSSLTCSAKRNKSPWLNTNHAKVAHIYTFT